MVLDAYVGDHVSYCSIHDLIFLYIGFLSCLNHMILHYGPCYLCNDYMEATYKFVSDP